MGKVGSDGRATHFVAGGLFEQVPSTGTWKKYYRLGGKLVAERDSAAGLTSLHQDHLGSTSLQTSSSGISQGQQLRGPFGQPWLGEGTLNPLSNPATDFEYTGQRSFETSLGSLMHYGARWYSPVFGRFLSPDTIVPNPGKPQDLNRYAYVRGNPLAYVDPTGHVATGPRTIAKPGDVEAGYYNENGHLLVGRWIQYDWGASFDRDGEIPWSMDQGGLLDDVASTANQALKDVVAQQAPDSRPGWDRPCQVDSGLLCNMIRPMGSILVPGPPMDCGPLCPGDDVSSGVRATGKATSGGASSSTAGGVYLLRNRETGQVMRTGRASSLVKRRWDHKNTTATRDLAFEVVYRTDNYAEQRGLEQILYDRYPEAPLNINRPIKATNPNRQGYAQAARDYLSRLP